MDWGKLLSTSLPKTKNTKSLCEMKMCCFAVQKKRVKINLEETPLSLLYPCADRLKRGKMCHWEIELVLRLYSKPGS